MLYFVPPPSDCQSFQPEGEDALRLLNLQNNDIAEIDHLDAVRIGGGGGALVSCLYLPPPPPVSTLLSFLSKRIASATAVADPKLDLFGSVSESSQPDFEPRGGGESACPHDWQEPYHWYGTGERKRGDWR